MLLDADIILNTAAVNFAQSDMTNRQWMAYMALPTLLFCAVLFGLILLVFRKELKGVTIEPRESSPIRKPLTGREKLVTAVVICTILLWAGEGLLRIAPHFHQLHLGYSGGYHPAFCTGSTQTRRLAIH